MFQLQHLLVPLDGSPMAEQALPVAAAIARKCGSRVTLLHVLEDRPPAQVHGQPHLVDRKTAEKYLAQLAEKWGHPQAEKNPLEGGTEAIDWHVHPEPTRDTVEGLTFHADEFQADLLVMCGHGPVRLRDRIVGNIAQQLARHQKTPVLLLHPTAGGEIPLPFRSILAPLDGQAEHEQGLAVAEQLAKVFDAAIHLVTAVSPARGAEAAATYLPGTTQRILEVQEQQSAEYLARVDERLRGDGLTATASVRRGDPARCLIAAADEAHADLVALTTHGKAGTHAFWSGSLTPKLLRRLPLAFLLTPVR